MAVTLPGCAAFIVLCSFGLFNRLSVSGENNLEIRGNPVIGETFRLVCSTVLQDNGVSYAVFNRRLQSAAEFVVVASIAYNPTCANTTETAYSSECNDDGTEIHLSIPVTDETEHNTYWRCATNEAPSAGDNNEVIVSITVPITGIFLVDPTGSVISVTENIATTFQCRTSPGRPTANISWYLNDNILTGGSTIQSASGNKTVTTGALSLTVDRSAHGHTVSCTGINYINMTPVQLHSKPTLNVTYGPGNSVTVGSSHYVVTEGEDVGPITCTADCNPPCSFKWFKDDVLINAGPVLEFRTVSKADAGEYKCEASTLVLGENKSSRVSLRIDVYYSPEITTIVGGGTYDVNDNVTLTCTVNAVPAPNITWWRQEDNSALQASITTSSSIILNRIQCDQMSNYICKAENTIGNAEMLTEVLVRCPPKESLPYERNVLSTLGSEAVLRITTVSFRLPSFTWRDPDQNIITSLDTRYSIMRNGANSMLVIHALQRMGSYTVTVSNGVKPDSVFAIVVKEQVAVNLVDDGSGNSIGLYVGLSFAGFVAGSILFSIICLCRKQLQRWQCCRERLYDKPKPQSDEHMYSEVSSPSAVEMTVSRDEIQREVKMTESKTQNESQIGQTYVNTGTPETQTYVNERKVESPSNKRQPVAQIYLNA